MRVGLPLLLVPCLLAADPVVVSSGPGNDYESWIGRLGDGRLMVVFDRNPDWRSGDLYVTFSDDDGASWSAAAPIITGPADQPLPCFLQLPGDTLRLWYSSNETGRYRIHSARSLDGLSWTEEGVVPLGWPPETSDYYDPTVIIEPDSSLTMLYSVSTTGAHVARRPWGGEWDTLRRLVAENGRRPRIMRHSDGRYLAAYQRRSGGGSYDIDVFLRTSTDLVNWSQELRLTDNLNSHDPFCLEGPDGRFLVWYAKYQFGVYNLRLRRSVDGADWGPEELVTADPVRNTQPHAFIEDGVVYLVYAHAVAYPDDHDVLLRREPYLGIAGPGVRSPLSVSLPAVVRRGETLRPAGCGPGAWLELFDAAGRAVLRSRADRGISSAGLATGAWFVRVHDAGRVVTCRVLVVE
ncbi:MAG TPA: hypothetical protein ENN51_02640 [candidate division WOR-3 bacterium]|uniref:Exo-alpha-sialidase n=1 Tax=candidate division WOR-3 bacterium TaxID=2052148 RepID=A0A7V0XF10_UNCW3|nr:hypothetical protein [candidate division WOR-3 bacterium]